MRLKILESYRPSLFNRFRIFLTRILFGQSTVDPARAAYYRPDFFTKTYYQLQHYLMRGPSEWSISERELFAAHTSFHNRCEFCLTVHADFASTRNSTPEWVSELLAGQADAQSAEMQVMLRFLEKLTKQPWDLSDEDVQELRSVGLSDEKIEEAIMVSVNFNIGSRLSDALGFEIPSPSALRRAKPVMRFIGYSFYT